MFKTHLEEGQQNREQYNSQKIDGEGKSSRIFGGLIGRKREEEEEEIRREGDET